MQESYGGLAPFGMFQQQLAQELAQALPSCTVRRMDLNYPINLVGHEEWVESGYEPALANGDVITRDGEFIGIWRVADYFLEDDYLDQVYEFIPHSQEAPVLSEVIGPAFSRSAMGMALSAFSDAIREWHDGRES